MIKCDGTLVARAHRVVIASFSSTFEELLLQVDGRSVVNLDIDSSITGEQLENKQLYRWTFVLIPV